MSATPNVVAIAPARVQTARLFYTGAAALAILVTLIGFHHFYFQGSSYPGRPITPPIRGLVITHGLVMTAWIGLFFVQPLLVALGQRRAHMKLGRVGALVGLAVVVTGLWIAVASARVSPPGNLIWSLTPHEFMAVPFFAGLFFAAFLGIGLWQRRRLEIHRPMMMLSTYSVLSAPISRIDALSNLYVGTIWDSLFGPFLMTQILLGILLLVRWMLTGRLDRWLSIGFLVLTVGYMLVMQGARTDAWRWFAGVLTGM